MLYTKFGKDWPGSLIAENGRQHTQSYLVTPVT